MSTEEKVFTLQYNEVNKNYKVLVDGKVHPLLCGNESVSDAVVVTTALFGDEFNYFSNFTYGKQYFSSGGISSKTNAIDELQKFIDILKAVPPDDIEDIELEINIDFNR